MNPSASSSLPVILVDDEEDLLFTSSLMLRRMGIATTTLSDGRELLPLLERLGGEAVVVLDLIMPHVAGEELLQKLVEHHHHIPVIVMTAVRGVDMAVSCMKMGAFDYLVKPVEENRFTSCVSRAVEHVGLKNRVDLLKDYLVSDRLDNPGVFAHIITRSKKMRGIFQYVEAIAPSREPVLVTGETGVGKESLVSAIHRLGHNDGPLITVNVAGLDDPMFSDTLFGHRKGAFTGADSHRDGLIAKAAGGVLFLDEIGDLEPSSQVKLLHLVQERRYRALGSDVLLETDARIICATNRNLRQAMTEGTFRADLFYRLSAHQVHLPPLRERPEDLLPLTGHFLQEAAREMNKRPPTPPPELFTLLTTFPFPGNIRELRAMIYDAVARHRSGVLSMESFRTAMDGTQQIERDMTIDDPLLTISSRFPTFKEAESFLIDEALQRAQGNQGIAADLLGLSRRALNKRLSRRDT